MAEVSGDGGHRVGHLGIGPECPIWCLGVRTVGDLVGLLVEAGRVSGLHAVTAGAGSGAGGGDGHEHVRVTASCPVGCLGLSAHAANPLRSALGWPATVGDVLGLLASGELAMVRGPGARRVGEVRTALGRGGFSGATRRVVIRFASGHSWWTAGAGLGRDVRVSHGLQCCEVHLCGQAS